MDILTAFMAFLAAFFSGLSYRIQRREAQLQLRIYGFVKYGPKESLEILAINTGSKAVNLYICQLRAELLTSMMVPAYEELLEKSPGFLHGERYHSLESGQRISVYFPLEEIVAKLDELTIPEEGFRLIARFKDVEEREFVGSIEKPLQEIKRLRS